MNVRWRWLAPAIAVALAAASASSAIAASLLPVAVPDTATVVHGRTKSVAAPGVLQNDILIGVDLLPGKAFTAKLVSGPAHGHVNLQPDGRYAYEADDDFAGIDVFRYRVEGGLLGASGTTTVTITVTNTAPVARPDDYDAVPDVELSVPGPGLMTNDTDADGDALVVDVLSETDHGNLNEDDDGSFRYKADETFRGIDTFTYRVGDGVIWSSAVTVELHVGGPLRPRRRPLRPRPPRLRVSPRCPRLAPRPRLASRSRPPRRAVLGSRAPRRRPSPRPLPRPPDPQPRRRRTRRPRPRRRRPRQTTEPARRHWPEAPWIRAKARVTAADLVDRPCRR